MFNHDYLIPVLHLGTVSAAGGSAIIITPICTLSDIWCCQTLQYWFVWFHLTAVLMDGPVLMDFSGKANNVLYHIV